MKTAIASVIVFWVALLEAHSVDANVVQVSAGNEQTCMISSDVYGYKLYCWGGNGYGQVGIGTNTVSEVSPRLVASYNYTNVQTGMYHTCAVTYDGGVDCWGYGLSGQLGNNTWVSASTPQHVLKADSTRLLHVQWLTVGAYHSCASAGTPGIDNVIWCWGWNGDGQLGTSDTTSRNVATQTVGSTFFISGQTTSSYRMMVSAGYDHTCAVNDPSRTNAAIWCWGKNDNGQLGRGDHNDRSFPTIANGFPDGAGHACTTCHARSVYAGYKRTMATDQYTNRYRWGAGLSLTGFFDDGSEHDVPFYVSFPEGTNDIVLSWALDYGMFNTNSGRLYVWSAYNGSGQLADGTVGTTHIHTGWEPQDNTQTHGLMEPFVAMGVGVYHACAVRSSDPWNLWCWGLGNNGRLGYGGGIWQWYGTLVTNGPY